MPPERIRILRVTEQAILGGEQTDILYLLSGLDPSRYEQVVCTAPTGPFVDEVRRLGIPHIPLTMRSKFDLRAVLHLRRIIRAGRYDIVHLHGARAGLLGRIAARLAGAPLIVWTMHVFQPDVLQGWRRWQTPLYLLVEAALARFFCDHIVTVSENLRQRALRLEHIPASRISTIYSGTDLTPFACSPDRAAIRWQLGIPPEALVVCTVGRLCEQKGIGDLVRAAAIVHQQMPDVRFLIVGDGPLRSEVEALAARLGLNGRVTFLGFRNDVPEILFASDVFATATLWEGFGKVNVEAMAAGLPLVSTNVGPIPEVVGDYPGAILVPPRDPPAFAEALLTILNDLASYASFGEEGRQRAYQLFGREAFVQRTDQLYKRLLAEKGIIARQEVW